MPVNKLVLVQDVVVAHLLPYQKGTKNAYNLAIFAVADGHNGNAAAQHVEEMLCSEIKRHLPSNPPPIAPGTDGEPLIAPTNKPRCNAFCIVCFLLTRCLALTVIESHAATKKYAEQLREAVATTFLTLEAQFVLTGQLSGQSLLIN